jgi:flagellar biosynthesis protein FlhG
MPVLWHTDQRGVAINIREPAMETGKKGTAKKEKHIWAIAGGKGGIGKSFVAANLGIALCERGKKVVVVDLDLGGANLHTLLGIARPPLSLDDFIRKGMRSIKGILAETGIPNLQLIAGVQDMLTLSNPKPRDKQKIIHHIASLNADHIILDVGTGFSPHVFDFFLISDTGIFLITPERTSLENAYRFMRGVFLHRWMTMSPNKKVRNLIETAMDVNNAAGIRTPVDLLAHVEELDKEAKKIFATSAKSFKPRLIINQARNRTEAELGFAIRSVCRKYFGIDLGFLGYILYDYNVYSSVQRGRAFFSDYPSSDVAECIRNIAAHVSDGKNLEWSLS